MINTLLDAINIIKSNADFAVSDTVRDNDIIRSVREAIILFRGKRYWFLQKTQTVSLALSATFISVPDDFAMMDSFDLLYGGSRYSADSGFDCYDYQAFKRIFLSTASLPSGRPCACALLNRTLYFDRAVDRSDAAIDFTYFAQDLNLPINPTDTSVFFGEDSFDVVVSLAEHIFMRRSMQNAAADQAITQNYQDILLSRHQAYDRGIYA